MKNFIKTGCAALGLIFSSACFAQSLTTPVFTDAGGKKVIGRYGGPGIVIVGTGDQTVVLPLQTFPTGSGFTWGLSFVYYASPGCTGKAYLFMPYSGGLRFGSVAKRGTQTMLFVSAVNAARATNRETWSLQWPNGEGCLNFESPQFIGNDTVEIETSMPIDRLGTPPFFIK